MKRKSRLLRWFVWSGGLLALAILAFPTTTAAQSCEGTVVANVVALDQVFFWNRMGAVQPQGMMFALARDVVSSGGSTGGLAPGNVKLRRGKRPRPIVLRMNVGDCLTINFTNLLAGTPVDAEQPATRSASVHVVGMQLVGNIGDDGSNVGTNASSLVAPGGSASYTLYAEREGQHVLYSAGATTGGEGDGGQVNAGLFGAVNVEPTGSVWYRSQVTEADLALATTGYTADGHPIVDYNATYTDGTPIFNMLSGNEIVHSDLTAIIGGGFTDTYPLNPVYPDRDQSFREFTIIYHDEVGAVQAFEPLYDDPVLGHTLHSVRDAFAINYGTGGVGSEILANRLGVGPMADCTGCKYEEFFLTSWTVGDPAMVVDVPADASDPAVGYVATRAFYPDDPSNVYHSYLKDHVKFRILHGGSKEHHIHHQHAHQWLFTPDSDESAYLDSQALGPGTSFTLEMAYDGSGNRNQTVGDSIFHCHFYPHFAQGMWALWRVHDVFEDGSRMLPDGEIAQGTPIPGVVPIPGLAMAPMPGVAVTIAQDPRFVDPATGFNKRGGQVKINGEFVYDMTGPVWGNPGYPFWIPGVGGSRPPHPPLDTIDDGGLPRHVLLQGETVHVETRLDFTKEIEATEAIEIPETGAPVELAAMAFHEQRNHPSYTPEGKSANFIANGLPRQPGAPFADPCVADDGTAKGRPRTYKAANIQLDVIFNKAGWHFPQQRIITLWDDVAPTYAGTRPPEPFFFRANTDDCISFYTTNLVPNIYEMDDFQVRTPTDILGQHIHLVKFDVLGSDGSANGWNYEDGTFSPDEVIERINAIRAHNGCDGSTPPAIDGTFECPVAEAHPYFGVLGAQTTVQRWFVDDVLNLAGEDRTLRTVFTHDHYGPSTHQQAGLYASLVIEPERSTWRDPETGMTLGSRADGGPTSWKADILTPDSDDSYREFMLQYTDFALAYEAGGSVGSGTGPTYPKPWTGVARAPGGGFDDPAAAINPPARIEAGPHDLVQLAPQCPGGAPRPCPEAISADDVGTMVVNYRNEPIALRVRDPQSNSQAEGHAGDLSFAFSSKVNRKDPAFNVQPNFYSPLTGGVQDLDPFTPLLRAYQGDNVQIRVQVGGTEEMHNFSMHGIKWLWEPSWENSGYRNFQPIGISEHFEYISPVIPGKSAAGNIADYAYKVGSSTDDLWNGLWGIMRAYRQTQDDLIKLPNNKFGKSVKVTNAKGYNGMCPKKAPKRNYDITAVLAQDVLPGGTLVYNSRGPLHDPTAILFVRTEELEVVDGGDPGCFRTEIDSLTLLEVPVFDPSLQTCPHRLAFGVPIEPLVLRANAGDCIEVTLKNRLPGLRASMPDLDGYSTLPMIVDRFNANDVKPSHKVGLHAQLVTYDVTKSDGANVGLNRVQTLSSNDANETEKLYRWYAGDISLRHTRKGIEYEPTPMEYGAVNLSSSDPIKHSNKGAIGALIIEPEGATWVEDADSRASATVTAGGSSFREFVLLFQDDLNLRFGDGSAVPNLADAEDPEDSGQKAFNYRTEPMWLRAGFAPDETLESTRTLDFTNVLSNGQVGGDPETPVFTANAGDAVRFRVLEPGGHQRSHVFSVHGHVWQQEPYINGSTEMGDNPLSLWEGATQGFGPTSHYNCLLENGAGGAFGVTGDYLYRDMTSFLFDGGLWGIFRVE